MARGKPSFVGHGEVDNRPGSRRNPALEALLELVSMDSPYFGTAMREVRNLKQLGVELTPDIARKIGERCIGYAKREAELAAMRAAPVPPPVGAVVYYARLSDRVKIGTTTCLAQRMQSINPEELLVTESGGVALERRRHRQFSHLRTHGEWFRLEGALAEHIEKLRAEQ
jgi:hypothetical protein